ncbi:MULTISPECIES: hypothetical protein [unclassified Bradyrhizobium]|uniref:hypothetical protein n=1 Tax=unclassified Bradyrhizobium TaxID=2631580 RepID=UPI0033959F7B
MTNKIEWASLSEGNVFSTYVDGIGTYMVKKRPTHGKRVRERWEGSLNSHELNGVVAATAEDARAMIELRILHARRINSLHSAIEGDVQEPATPMLDVHVLREAAIAAEAALGENLTWLADKFDLSIRQGDEDVKRRLDQLNEAWIGLTRAITEQ